jgi:hypothetical protein
MSAQSSAISTPEIFHLILAELPMRWLLTTAPLVCRRWRDTISASPTIQQKLFFQPLPENTTRQPKFQINLLLREVFPLWFQPRHFPPDLWDKTVFDGLPIARHTAAFVRRGASWRKMLVQQPPAPSLCIMDVRFEHSQSGEWIDVWNHWAIFDDEGGLRMGPLYDLVYSWVGVSRQHCRLSWRRLPPPDLEDDPLDKPPDDPPDDLSDDSSDDWLSDDPLDKQEVRDAAELVLEKVDVVLQRLNFRPVRGEFRLSTQEKEWKEKFRCEEFEAVQKVSDKRSTTRRIRSY